MPRQTDRRPLPAVLAAPDSADRLATELELAAHAVTGDDPLAADRRRFLGRAAGQVAAYGTEAVDAAASAEPVAEPTPSAFTPRVMGGEDDDLETRGA